MKTAFLTLFLIGLNANAIENISADDVARHLRVQSAIEISRASAEAMIENQNPDFQFQTRQCQMSLMSRSARAYVVKRNSNSELVVTSSGLRELISCGRLD